MKRGNKFLFFKFEKYNRRKLTINSLKNSKQKAYIFLYVYIYIIHSEIIIYIVIYL